MNKEQEILNNNMMREPEKMRRIFVKNLSDSITDEILRDHFEKFGKVDNMKSAFNPETRKSKDFAFVLMGSSAEVDRVLAEQSHVICGRKVQVKRALTKELMCQPDMSIETTRIFVAGMTKDTTEKEMRMYFSAFGNVNEAIVVLNKLTNESRQFGFVKFDRADIVDKVLLHGDHYILGKQLNVKKATSKPEVVSKPIRCICGGKLYWRGPNMGANGRDVRGRGDFCMCGASKQQCDPGAGWSPSKPNFMYGAGARSQAGLMPLPFQTISGCNFYQVPPPLFPEMLRSPPPPYTPHGEPAYQQQISHFKQSEVNSFIKYKNSPFYDFDYEQELFKQAYPNGATKSQQQDFFQFGIGRPVYACGLHFDM